jgi:hypothetical protein
MLEAIKEGEPSNSNAVLAATFTGIYSNNCKPTGCRSRAPFTPYGIDVQACQEQKELLAVERASLHALNEVG